MRTPDNYNNVCQLNLAVQMVSWDLVGLVGSLIEEIQRLGCPRKLSADAAKMQSVES